MTLVLVQVGIVLAIVVHGLVCCVLYYRITKLRHLVSIGTNTRQIIGFDIPTIQAINARTGQIVSYTKSESSRLCLLIVSSGCVLCQKIVFALQGRTITELDDVWDLDFVVYCRGSQRGAISMLANIDSRVTLLVSHEVDIAKYLPVSGVPVLITTDSFGKVDGHTYPFSSSDVFGVLSTFDKNSAISISA